MDTAHGPWLSLPLDPVKHPSIATTVVLNSFDMTSFFPEASGTDARGSTFVKTVQGNQYNVGGNQTIVYNATKPGVNLP